MARKRKAKAVAVTSLDDVCVRGQGSIPDRVVFRLSPQTEKDEVGILLLPPVLGSRLGLSDELNRATQRIFRMGGGVTNELSIVAKLAEGSNGKTKIPAPPTRSIPIRQWGKTENFHQNSVAMMRSGW